MWPVYVVVVSGETTSGIVAAIATVLLVVVGALGLVGARRIARKVVATTQQGVAEFWTRSFDSFLGETARLISDTTLTQSEVLRIGAKAAARALQCPFAFIALIDAEQGTHKVEVVEAGSLAGEAAAGFRTAPYPEIENDGLLRAVHEERKAHTMEVGEADPLVRLGVYSAVAAPLQLACRPSAVIAACNRPRTSLAYPAISFGGNDRQLLRFLAWTIEQAYAKCTRV